MKYTLEVVADYNDGDYLTEMSDITEKHLEKLKPLIKAIKGCDGDWNWRDTDNQSGPYVDFTIHELEDFDGFLPYAPDGLHIHTVESIYVYEKPKKKRLL